VGENRPVTGPDPALAAVRSAVRAALADLPPGARVLVACSGGADSLALAAGTAFVARAAGITAGAVIVDHGWHPDSARVTEAAAAACRALGLSPVEAVTVSATGRGGPEAAARDARYAALLGAADRFGAAAVLLGHTLDDQAETVLLGLARGSGARSLSGMAARRGILRRPLLQLPRTTTLRACAALGLQPWHDPANDDRAYTRVRLRQATGLLTQALGDGLVPALARTADLLREDAAALDALAGELLDRARIREVAGPPDAPGAPDVAAALGAPSTPDALDVADAPDGDALVFDVGTLAGAPPAVRRRAVLSALRLAGAPAGALGRRHVLAVDALLVAWHGQGPVHLPARVVARRDCGRLLLAGPTGRDRGDTGRPPLVEHPPLVEQE
jgi:tRNA(Ile)-lysidine synthase